LSDKIFNIKAEHVTIQGMKRKEGRSSAGLDSSMKKSNNGARLQRRLSAEDDITLTHISMYASHV
ncbi:MAG: hypothetical protein ACRDD9_05070, partial [Shewanella sp.]